MEKQNQTKIIIRDFTVPARIGIYPQELAAPQSIRVSIDVTLKEHEIKRDNIEDTLSYEGLVAAIRNLQKQHFNLVEIMAEHLASIALADVRVQCVCVKIEKIEIYAEGHVGTEITRYR